MYKNSRINAYGRQGQEAEDDGENKKISIAKKAFQAKAMVKMKKGEEQANPKGCQQAAIEKWHQPSKKKIAEYHFLGQ